jgi:hypothetical protein
VRRAGIPAHQSEVVRECELLALTAREDEMSDLAAQIAMLLEQTEQTRQDFLQAEVHAVTIALDMARFEYERGHVAFASREVDSAAKGIAVNERFLPQARAEYQMKLGKKLARLQAALESVRRDFPGKSRLIRIWAQK